MLNFAPSEACGAHTLFVCCLAAGRRDVRLAQLAPPTDLNRPGVSAAALVAVAQSDGIDVQPTRPSLADLLRWGQPAVLHVNGDHFIAMLGEDSGRLVIFDNSIGLIDCAPWWFDQQYGWDGVALVIGRVPMWRAALGSYWFTPVLLAALVSIEAARRRRGALFGVAAPGRSAITF
ncbi:MAG TPA: cysteine peptidase family C39 domain-containing protein [Pirellulales bacterium]|nr:cysteine peptidase family C39 domain-containing protein [Pirellulales bacterium]